MKSSSSFNRRALAKFAVLTTTLLFTLPALLRALPPASGPSVTVPASVSINDEQATNLFATATVSQAGVTNVSKVFVDFSPTNFGSLTLPPNGALVNGTNVLTVTNATDAEASLRLVGFTPVANLIPVPNTSNVVFHVRVMDTNAISASGSTTLHITATNNAPTLTAAAPFTYNITDKTNAPVFTNVTIADVDDSSTQSVTVTITLDATNKGTFTSLSGFVYSGGSYTFTGTATNATTAIQQLVFIPTPNHVTPGTSETTTFTISVDDNYATPLTSSAYSVTALSINDAPTIAAGAPFTNSITDKTTNTPVFTNVTIADVDLSGLQVVSVTLTLDDTNKGTFTIPVGGSNFTNAGASYVFSGTSAAATTALRALVFVPTPNHVPVDTNETTTFKIFVDDHFGGTVTNAAYSVTALSINDAPQLTGVVTNHFLLETGHSLSPFSVLTLSDVDQNLVLTNENGENLSWSVALSGPAPLGYLELNGVNLGTSYSSSNDPAMDTANLRLLVYHAPTVGLASTNTLTFAITASDAHGGTVSNNVLLDLYSVVLPPGLSGVQSGQIVNDKSTLALFSKVGIQTFNGNSVTVLISLTGVGVTNDAKGLLINLGSFTKTTSASAPSLYQFTGTSESATAAIRALLFQPTPNRINGSTNDTANFAVTLIDGPFTNTDSTTAVIVFPVNDAPAIAGISPTVTIDDNKTYAPFTAVLITDADEFGQQTVTATITLDDVAKGVFSTNSVIASGFANNGTNYTFTGSPASLTAAIRQLVFIPKSGRVAVGLSENTTFTIRLDDGHAGIVINSATVVRVNSVGGTGPFVNLPPQPASIRIATNIFAFADVTVSDPTFLNLGLRINNPAQGAFTTNSLASSGFTNRGGGFYFISGWATNLNASLAQLDFAPATNLLLGVTINFTISVTNTKPSYVSVNHAIVLRKTQNSFIVTKLTDYDPTNAAYAANGAKVGDTYGTLRRAIASAESNDHITFDIRSTTVGQPDYPAVIHLVAPLVLDNNLTFDGPGAERLTISGDSDTNGTPDVQLFTVNAAVTMNRLAFAKGHANYGGAFEVSPAGDLKLSYCAVTDSTADFWGGGIDVNQGSLTMDHCLIAGNSISSGAGQDGSGGGVSLYTYWPCAIVNTTFATNRQNAVGGLGGGALYAATSDPGIELDVEVLSCTFHDNRDASGHGTSIRPDMDDNTLVKLQNTIVADGQGKNIEMDWGGLVVSLGGNISDDATGTIFTIGGGTGTNIFNAASDRLNVNATNLFSALSNNGGPTLTFPLVANSTALGNATSNSPAAVFYSTLGTDQRGYFRDHSPDIGAFERGAGQRIIIEELRFNPGPSNINDQFIEFYVPRDSTNLDVAGFKVLVDGVLRHTFTSQPLQAGEALVLFSSGAVSNGVPAGVHRQIATNNLMMDTSSGLITLLNTSNQVVFEADYVGTFVSTDPADILGLFTNYQSLVLSPQFQGVFLPYQRVVAKAGGSDTNGLANPGNDATGNPLAIGNAPPLAYADSAATDAHTVIPALNVLANDVDPDIADAIRVVAVGTNGFVSGYTNYSVLGARIIINDSPTTGATVSYDPTASAMLTALPQGSNVVDSFQYTILDSLNGADHYRGTNAADTSSSTYFLNLGKATTTVTVSVVGVNSAPTPQNDDVTTRTNLTTPEDVVLDFTTATNILWNDTDPNSDDNSSTLNIVSICETNSYVSNRLAIVTALGATATLDIRFDRNETHITYDPRGSAILNALGVSQMTNDTFYYSVKDRYNTIGTAAISIRVTGVNDVPTANPNALATDEDTAITNSAASLLANATDPDNGHVLHISAIVTPVSALGASVTLANGTNVIYDPTVSTNLNALANKEFATDTFTYTVMDENGLTSNAVVTVTVAGVNDRPISQPDFYSTDEETLFATNSLGVLFNDVEPDINGILPDDSFRVIPATNTTPGGVVVVMNADGSFSYNPHGLFDWLKFGTNTTETIDYVVMDHSLSIANDDNFAVTATTSNNILPVLANDVVLSQAGGAFTLTGVTTPNHGGTVALNDSNNAVIYTPLADFVGAETFSYSVADGLGGSDTAHVTVTVTASTLYANADAFTVAKGTTNSLDVLINDNILPPTGAAISVTGLGTPSLGGTVSFNGVGPNNLINYTPNPAQPCPFVEAFTYTITSGSLVSTGTVLVTVIDRNSTLPAKIDYFSVFTASGNNSLDVLANDLILPGPNTNLVIASFVSNSVLGMVSLNTAHTRLIYKPNNLVTSTNYSEGVQYTISDNAGGTADASAVIQVVSSGFIANPDTFVVEKNSGTNTLPVMINDAILPNDGQTLFISDLGIGTNAPNHGGTVAINGPKTGLVYTPAANFTGVEDFTYEISDGSPARALGHVRVEVLDLSVVPSNPDTYRVQRDSTANALFVLQNDYTLPKTPGALTLTGLETNGVHALITVNGTSANNSLLYTPNTGFIGRDIFNYEFTDTLGNKGTNTVTVTVGSLYPQDDVFSVLSESSANVLDVLTNDLIYPDGTSVRNIYQVGAPDHGGVAVLNGSATAVLYTPAPNFTGVESFTYKLKDDSTNLFAATVKVKVVQRGSDRDTNTVTMTIIGVNDIPTIVGSTNSAITDKQTVNPFATMTIGDLDEYNQQIQTVTITMDHLDNETLQNLGGFVQVSPGIFKMTNTPPNVTTALRGIVFVPVENHIIVPTTNTTHLLLSVDDGYVTSPVTNLTTVAVTAVNDAPTTAGADTYNITDKQTVNPFATVTIAEVDDDTLQSLTVHIVLDHVDNQSLTNLGGFTPVTDGLFALTGTAANITASLRGIVFVPTPNHITVPTTVTTRLTLTVDDAFAPTVTNNLTTVSITASNDAPTITGTVTNSITDKQTVNPFATVTIADVDNDALQSLTVQIALDHLDNQSLTNLGGFTQVTNGLFTLTSTPTNITAALRGIVFVPTPNHITVSTSVTTRLTLTVDDAFAPIVSDNSTTVTITSTNDAPTITGNGNYHISDKQTVQPFATIVVADVDDDALQPLTVDIAMDNLDKGALQNLGGFTQITNGLFEIYGTATNITAALRGIIYVPVPNHIPVPTTVPTHLTLFAADGFVSDWVTNMTTVSVTASNDAPVISGTVAGQLVYNRSSIKPFVTALISEVDNDKTQALRITVTLDNAIKGALSSLGGFSDLGGGVYSYGVSNGTVTAAMATTALRGLLFTPSTASRVSLGVNETTRFTIRVDDFYAPTVVDSNTTVVAIYPLTAKVTAADKANGAEFGWSVATTRDLAVVGAPHDSQLGGNAGAAYLFSRSQDGSNTWTQIKKLLAPDGHASDEFGTAVSISGDIIVVSAPSATAPASHSGAVYIFARNQGGSNAWGFVKKIASQDTTVADYFGYSVSVSGTNLVVGSPWSDVPGSTGFDNGAAYVFAQNQGGSNGWGLVKKLVSPDAAVADYFGYSVSVSGTNLMVGSPWADGPGGSSGVDNGTAYIFSQNQGGGNAWGVVKKLVSPDATGADYFGYSVSVSGTNLVVGSPWADGPGGSSGYDNGAAYVFSQNQGGGNGWGFVKKLASQDATGADYFGYSVSIDDVKVVAGSWRADGGGTDSGSAYLFAQNQGGSNVWGQVDKFLPAAVGASDYFGAAVAISSNTVVVGAYNGQDSGVRYGTAFMFRIKFNNGPRVLIPLADQTVTPSSPLAYTIPAGAFTDPDVNEILAISLGVSPVPPVWLNFDPVTGAFSGTPSVVGIYPVAVVATDSDGLSATNPFSIYVAVVPADHHSLSLGFQTYGPSQVIVVTLNGAAGAAYKLQRTPSLSGNVIWTDVATGTAGVDGAIVFYDASSSESMFYRAVPQ